MVLPSRVGYILFGGLLAALLVITGLSVFSIIQQQRTLSSPAEDYLQITVVRLPVEFNRFQERLAGFAAGVNSAVEVQLRYDILLSRLDTLILGDSARMIAQQPESQKDLEQIQRLLTAMESAITSMDNPITALPLLQRLRDVEHLPPILSTRVNRFITAIQKQRRQQLSNNYRWLGSLLIATLVVISLLVLMLVRHLRFTEQARRLLSQQAEHAIQRRILDNTLEAMQEGVAMVDSEGKLLVWNRSMAELLDVDPSLLDNAEHYSEILTALANVGEWSDSPRAASEQVAYMLQRDQLRTTPAYVERHRPNGRVIAIRTDWLAEGGFVRTVTDITATKKAQWQTESERAFLREILEASPVGVTVTRPEGGELLANAAITRLLGYNTREFLEHHPLQFWVDPECRQTLFSTLHANGEVHNHPALLRTRDGEHRHTLISACQIRFEEDAAVICWVVDVTTQQHMENALRRERSLLRATMNNVSQAIVMVDENLNIIEHNSRLTEIFELPAAVVKERPNIVALYEYRLARGDLVGEVFNSVTYGNQVRQAGRRMIRHNERYIEAFCQALTDGGYVITYLDLTHERRVAEELAEKSEFQRALLQAIPIPINVKDSRGRYILCNDAFADFIGHPVSAILGRRAEDIYSREAIRHFLAADSRLLRNHGPREIFEAEVPGTQGEQRDCIVQKAVVSGTSGTSLITAFVDISARKAAERALQEAKDAAETANRAKSTFLANISHELRTPLNAILGFGRLLEQRIQDGESREQLQIIHHSGEHLLTLINEVLDMAKIEAGRMTLEEGVCELDEMLSTLDAMFRLPTETKGLTLRIHRDSTLPAALLTDAGKLRQVLINLLANAVKFTREGEVELSVQYATSDPQHMVFRVSDSGVGIASEELPLLFDAFGQTSSGRQSHEGTGLGLPISQAYVQLMGGDIQVSSTPGKGSVFHFQLPLRPASVIGVRPTILSLQHLHLDTEQLRHRLLVVDDQLTNRRLLGHLLNHFGFEIQYACNGEEAIDLWTQWRPALIFMDMRMPVLDGQAATRRIKAHPEVGDTRIVAVTASAFEEERRAILADGCDDFISKPFQLEDVISVLQRQLQVNFLHHAKPLPNNTIQHTGSDALG